jgi:hypothetical protein
MLPQDQTEIEIDALTVLARFIYEEMNVEPRQMHSAIVLARRHLAEIHGALIEMGLRISPDSDAA